MKKPLDKSMSLTLNYNPARTKPFELIKSGQEFGRR